MTPDALLALLSPETKASILANEFRLGRIGLADLQGMLALFAATDLERFGLIELIRRQGAATGLTQIQLDALVATLGGAQAAPPAPPPMSMPPPPPSGPGLTAWESKTIRISREALPQKPQKEEGATFQVKTRSKMPAIPAAPAPAQAPAEPPPLPPAAEPPPARASEVFYGSGMAGMVTASQKMRRILLADDDNRIRMVFRKKLEELALVVDEATSGDEAWKKISETRFALIVMDMKMPGLHGLDLLGRLSALPEKPPVVVCTAYEQLREEFVITTYPSLRFLVKPVPIERLQEAVRSLLDLA